MGWRVNRRIRLFGGIYMNVSKRGTSFTARTKGVSITSGKKSGRATVGLPGTGLSYSKSFSKGRAEAAPIKQRGFGFKFFFALGSMVWAFIAFAILKSLFF